MPTLPTDLPALKKFFQGEFPVIFDDANEYCRPFADDYMSISEFLIDEDRVIAALATLNEKCVEDFNKKAKLGTIKWTDIYESDFRTTKPFGTMKFRKVLTDVLEENEQSWGFNQGAKLKSSGSVDSATRARKLTVKNGNFVVEEGQASYFQRGDELPKGAPTLNDFVDPDDFRNFLLQFKYQFKDPGAGADHGEFTHRLQWFAVCTAYEANDLALHNRPSDLFCFLCNDYCVAKTMKPPGGKNFGLWDCLVDAFRPSLGPAYPTSDDFRSPNRLNDYLVSPGALKSEEVGLIAHILKNRAVKRTEENKQMTKNSEYVPHWQEKLLRGVEGYIKLSAGNLQQPGTINFLDKSKIPSRV